MSTWTRFLLVFALVLSPFGCSYESDPAVDAALDSGVVDAAASDSGPVVDAAMDAATDGGVTVPLAGFGDITGQCGVLDDTEWNTAAPFLFRNDIDFGTQTFDASALTPGGQEIWVEGNLGGSSIHSEIFAYEVLARCELAELLKTEGQIEYTDDGGKKTDLLVKIDGRKVGVSVTRAFHYPPSDPYTLTEATDLLTQKLDDILLSAANAKPVDAWERSVLSVIAYDADYADAIETAFSGLDASVVEETILIVTVTDGTDDYIY